MVRVAGLRRQVAAGVAADAARRAHAAGAARRDRRRGRAAGALQRALPRRSARRARAARRPARSRVQRPHAGRVGRDRRVLRVAGLSGAHAARGRSRASVPVHLESLAVARGRDSRSRARRDALRAREGAEEPAALGARDGRPNHFVPLEQVIGANLGALFPGMEVVAGTRSASRATPISRFRSKSRKICSRRSRSRCSSAGSARSMRVEVQDDMPAHLRALLLDELREDDVPERGRLDGARHSERRAAARPGRSDRPRDARHAGAASDPPFAPIDAGRAARRRRAASSTSFARATCSCIIRSIRSRASVERFLEEAARRRPGARDQADAVSHVGRHGARRARSSRPRSAASRWR